MTSYQFRVSVLAFSLSLAVAGATSAANIAHPDHYEFDATLNAPLAAVAGRYPITLFFDYPASGTATAAAWTLEAVAPNGRVVRRWQGIQTLPDHRASLRMSWDGRDQQGRALEPGYYTLRLRAAPTLQMGSDTRAPIARRISQAFSLSSDEIHEQSVDVMIGRLTPALVSKIEPLPVGVAQDKAARRRATAGKSGRPGPGKSIPATGGLPYTIYYGNMHSQTNHSDGGTALASCSGSESPQAGAFGPADAYAMMRTQAGGDFLLASEHNHEAT